MFGRIYYWPCATWLLRAGYYMYFRGYCFLTVLSFFYAASSLEPLIHGAQLGLTWRPWLWYILIVYGTKLSESLCLVSLLFICVNIIRAMSYKVQQNRSVLDSQCLVIADSHGMRLQHKKRAINQKLHNVNLFFMSRSGACLNFALQCLESTHRMYEVVVMLGGNDVDNGESMASLISKMDGITNAWSSHPCGQELILILMKGQLSILKRWQRGYLLQILELLDGCGTEDSLFLPKMEFTSWTMDTEELWPIW